MALVKKVAETTSVAAGQFEEIENEGTTVDNAAEATVETAAEAAAADAKPSVADKAKVAATVAVAKAQTTAVGAVAPKFETALGGYQNALPAIDFGVLPRIKASNGAAMDGDDNRLGETFQMTLISFNDNYVVTPGVDDAKSTEFVRYSLDGVTIDSTGQLVSDYINELKTVEGYKDAEMKNYLDVIGILNSSEKPSEHLGNMVQVSMSPQSRKSFEAYRLQQSVKIKMGRAVEEGSEELTFKAVVKTMGNYTFTSFQVSATVPA